LLSDISHGGAFEPTTAENRFGGVDDTVAPSFFFFLAALQDRVHF
jgi:hypothetical protein